jgi:hypothetical protein
VALFATLVGLPGLLCCARFGSVGSSWTVGMDLCYLWGFLVSYLVLVARSKAGSVNGWYQVSLVCWYQTNTCSCFAPVGFSGKPLTVV